MKRALIIIAIILLIAAVVGVVLLGGLMMNNYAETGSIFGSGFDLSGGFWENIIGDEVLGGIDTSPRPTEPDNVFTGKTDETDQELPSDESVFIYELLDDGTYAVKIDRTVSEDGILRIPDSLNGKPVTVVKSSAVSEADKTSAIKEVIIPDSVTTIEPKTFATFENLEKVVLGNRVTTIGDAAFNGCRKLKSINLPDSLQYIGVAAFQSCRGLQNIVLPKSLTTIGSYAFQDCIALSSIVIPDSIETIEEHSFSYCASLESVTLRKGVKKIKDNAFYECTALSEIILNEGLEEIGLSAFAASAVTSIHIPSSVTYVQPNFLSSQNLNSITVDPQNAKYHAANNCLIKTEYKTLVRGSNTSVIPSDGSVEVIGNFAFYDLTLSEITIPETVIHIMPYAFENCTSLTKVNWHDNIQAIGINTFYGCSSLGEIDFPENLTTLDGNFSNCTSLHTVNLSKNIQGIGARTFYGCESLKTINYDGTKEEWNAVGISPEWKNKNMHFTVVCTDGEIEY
ncbi:MAG: leucine-rich repeat protein [Clostridia bacterium]|nr:leucine-rich repeat protein [Clostridia bacterium]